MVQKAGKVKPARVIRWDDEADVVIVGGGGAGIAAGIAARERGATSIVLEKEKNNLKAASNRAAGMFGVESSLQKRDGINYTRDQAFKQAVTYAHWQINAHLVRKIIDISGDTIDWLVQYGVKFPCVITPWPGGPPTWHIFSGDHLHPQLLPVMTDAAEKMGVKIIYGTPATGLIVEKGRVIGVEAAVASSGQTVKIRARKGVILASGGFGNNKEMLRKYTTWNERFRYCGCRSCTGDGIRMAEAAGASLEGMDILHVGQAKIAAPGELWVPTVQPLLFVNKDGERVGDESTEIVWPEMGNIILRQKDQTVIVIFDEDTKNSLINTGAKAGFHQLFWWKGKKATRLDEDIQEGEKRGFVKKTITIRGLAAAIGADHATLENTIARYNQSCDKKYDDMFLKDPEFLEPVRKPPFYALICDRPEYYDTLGGASVNDKCQILDSNLNVIPGLYAAGDDAGGMWAGCYNIYMCGGTMGFAVISGRIAGENAAAGVTLK